MLLGLATFLVAFGARMVIKQGLSGDEPHYLVMAQSLKDDHDLNVKNNYEQKTYVVFYKDTLEPHINWALIHKDSQKWYSIHGAGLAILTAPSMYIGKRFGPLLVMLGVGVLTIIQVYRLGARLAGKKAGIGAAFVLMTSIVYLSLVGYVFPDMLAGLLVLSAYSLLIDLKDAKTAWRRVALGVLCAFMIIVHVKTTLIALSIMGIGAWLPVRHESHITLQRRLTRAMQLMVPFLIVYGTFTLKLHAWYGILLPTQMYQGNGQMLQLSPLHTIPAMLFDGFKGLFVLSPALLLMFVGLPIWYRHNKEHVFILLSILVPSFVIQATFNDWGGGWGPPARYMMLYIPLLSCAIAYAWQAAVRSRSIKFVLVILTAIQVALSMMYIFMRTTWGSVGMESVFYANLKQRLGIGIPFLKATFDGNAVPNQLGITISLVGTLMIIGLFFIGYQYARNYTER